jgi:arylsulfatase A-like enzyme
MQTYAAMVKSMDDQVGAIIASLERNRLLEDTILIFTSDNGGERSSDTWPFTGQKTELLEGGIRVPRSCPGSACCRAASPSTRR